MPIILLQFTQIGLILSILIYPPYDSANICPNSQLSNEIYVVLQHKHIP